MRSAFRNASIKTQISGSIYTLTRKKFVGKHPTLPSSCEETLPKPPGGPHIDNYIGPTNLKVPQGASLSRGTHKLNLLVRTPTKIVAEHKASYW
jgi:hypothetical protein